MLQDRLAAPLAEEHFVANENVSRAQLVGLDLRDEAVSLRESPHQKASRIFETRVRANSRDSR